MRKRLLSILTILVLCFTLVACGNKTEETENSTTTDTSVVSEKESDTTTDISTTETLTTDEDHSNEIAINIIKNISGAIDKHKNETLTANINAHMLLSMTGYKPFDLSMIGDVKYCINGSYMISNTEIDLGEELGGKQSQKLEQYQIIDGNTLIQYNLDETSNEWVKSEYNYSEISNTIYDLSAEQFNSIELSETDTEYVVVGKTTSNKLSVAVTSFANTGMSDVPITLTITADKETLEYKTMTFDFDAFQTSEGLNANDIEMIITNTGIEANLMTVPDEIKNNAKTVEAVTETVEISDSTTAGVIYYAANDCLTDETVFMEISKIKQDNVCTISKTGEITPCEGNDIANFIEKFSANLKDVSFDFYENTDEADHWLIKRYLVQDSNGLYTQPSIHVIKVNTNGSEEELAP